jgi:hypothetical protein
MSNNLERFLGGSPSQILIKLVFLSLLVGALMAFLNITPFALIDGALEFVRRVLGDGWDAVKNLLWWAVMGAAVVVPIFLILRLVSGRR